MNLELGHKAQAPDSPGGPDRHPIDEAQMFSDLVHVWSAFCAREVWRWRWQRWERQREDGHWSSWLYVDMSYLHDNYDEDICFARL